MIEKLQYTLGKSAVLTETADIAPFVRESRAKVTGRALAVVLPESTDEVAQVMKLCYDNNIAMMVQGGNTGRVLGALCEDQSAVVISTNRLNHIREVDVENRSMTVEAGVVLEHIQQVAQEHDLFFPLSIGAQGSCQIGGNLATNCGGMNTLRYGNTRDLVLGIEAVMPNGEVMHTLHKLRKNNTGYDLRHLLIGSEGTLGIITACTLKLYPPEKMDSCAFVGLSSVVDAVTLLNRLQTAFPSLVSTFELISCRAMDFVAQYSDMALPMPNEHDWYVWYRLASTSDGLDEQHLDFLAELAESGTMDNVIFAQNARQKASFRDVREAVVKVQPHAKSEIKFDVSVPVAKIGELIAQGEQLGDAHGGFIAYPFGHVGDGNIHFNFTPPDNANDEMKQRFSDAVYDLVVSLGGSICAEHGIGKRKTAVLARYADPVALQTMHAIKHHLDPKGLMNPDVLFDL